MKCAKTDLKSNSWAAKLTEEQSWELFYKACELKWSDAAAWAVKEYDLPRMPSESAFWRWRCFMGEREHAHRLELTVIAQNHARQVAANYGITTEENVKQLVALGASLAIETGKADLGGELIEMALKIRQCETEKERTELERRKVDLKKDEIEMLKRRVAILEEREAKTKKVVKTKMTPEERDRRIREIFNID